MKEAWTVAIETLSWIELQKLSERMALSRTIKQLGVNNAQSIRLAYSLVAETLRRRNLIDKFVNKVLKSKEISEFDIGIQSFLRLFVYQTRIIKNWGKIDFEEAVRIANLGRAILGWKTLREIEPILGFLLTQKIEPILKKTEDKERVALETFHPNWFVEYTYKLLGREEAIKFLKANITPPETCIRLNDLTLDIKKIISILEDEEIKIEKIEPLKHTFRVLNTLKPLQKTKSYFNGLFYIQDKASCFATEAADPKPNMTIIDACAAPGAKTTYIAQLMENQGSIYSVDYSKRRFKVWKQEVERMSVKIAEAVVADVRTDLPFNIEANLIVLDPPCTSTGVFAKLPGAKWRLSPKSIENMTKIQWDMINCCALKVKSGGILAYSTCSITLEENEMIIERFINEHPEFKLTEISPKMGLPGLRGLEQCRRLYPHLHNSNGFFIARLQKK